MVFAVWVVMDEHFSSAISISVLLSREVMFATTLAPLAELCLTGSSLANATAYGNTRNRIAFTHCGLARGHSGLIPTFIVN
jgi:hypothetical protein